ncbi:MAG: alpha/beta hydrolase family protein [Gemmatimonadota bacterium]
MPENQLRRTPFQLEPRPGGVLRGDLWTTAPPREPTGRAVLVCHGFKGFKDWGFFPHAARHLASRLGCPVVTFNFTGSGVGADLENFTEPEAFGRNTFSKEVDDAAAVLDGMEAGRLGDATLPAATRIGTLGHSRGGVAAILSAERPSVRATVTWSAIASVQRYARLFDDVAPGEPVPVRNARTGQVLPLYPDVLRDVEENAERFDLAASLRRSGVPLLVVHGTADTSVPPADAARLAEAADEARLELIEGAGHTFEVGHPFEGPTDELTRVLELTTEHFATSLWRPAENRDRP